jgi:Family of unknown function (DUF6494)
MGKLVSVYSFLPSKRAVEAMMNEDTFNMELRKFLKKVGVTSQREIETAVREAIKAGRLGGNEKLKARVKLEVEGVNVALVIEDEIALA